MQNHFDCRIRVLIHPNQSWTFPLDKNLDNSCQMPKIRAKHAIFFLKFVVCF